MSCQVISSRLWIGLNVLPEDCRTSCVGVNRLSTLCTLTRRKPLNTFDNNWLSGIRVLPNKNRKFRAYKAVGVECDESSASTESAASAIRCEAGNRVVEGKQRKPLAKLQKQRGDRKEGTTSKQDGRLAGRPARATSVWRIFNVEVPATIDPGKDDFDLHPALLTAVATRLGCKAELLAAPAVRLVRKSFDARRPSNDELADAGKRPRGMLGCKEAASRFGMTASFGLRTVVVGSGPAGLFAALVLAEAGEQVVIIERGQPVETRGRDIGALVVRRHLDPNSNFCYGEGGAGTWSDGKLTTRIGKNGQEVQSVLAALVRFGAPERILVDGKPHLGTDRLVHILRSFRRHLEDLGVEILFGTSLEDLVLTGGRVTGVRVYEMLHYRHGVSMSPKGCAVGFRVEHPQELINTIQVDVHSASDSVALPDQRVGCYSFCMCPGGQVVPTSTSEWELCVNGMSFSKRASKWANAALVATCGEREYAPFVAEWGPLAGVAFQRAVEREAALMGGGRFVAPVQRVTDFLEGQLSLEPLPSSSYRLGVKSARLDELYPSHVTQALRQALVRFDRQLPGFVCDSGLLHGAETRTSSPVRIERDRGTFESVSTVGLYPIGEGAGYAGGIVSAAVDGMRAGLAIVQQMTEVHAP
eukprot:jgi/Mesen1/7089/ME000369S06416